MSSRNAEVDYFTSVHTESLSAVTEEETPPLNPTPLLEPTVESPPPTDATAVDDVKGSPPVEQPSDTTSKESKPKPRTSLISPKSLVSVLSDAPTRLPTVGSRFCHSGHALSELDAPSIMLQGLGPAAVKAVRKDGKEEDGQVMGVGSGSWRPFTEKEEKRLREALAKLNAGSRNEESALETGEDGKKEDEAVAELDSIDDDSIVPVGIDSLFHVKLSKPKFKSTGDQLQTQHLLTPSFWKGPSLLVVQSRWFYAPPASSNTTPVPAHLQKVYPVDLPLAEALEKALVDVRPDAASYPSELTSALESGVEGEEKLMRPLRLKDKKGKEEVEVIFTSKDQARLYSVGYLALGKVKKRIWSGAKTGFAGGQVVLRGWDALQAYQNARVTPAAGTPKPRSGSSSAAHSRSNSMSRPRTASSSSAVPSTTSFMEALKAKIGVASAISSETVFDDSDDEADDEARGRVASRNTEEAIQGPREELSVEKTEDADVDEELGEVDELCLVIHGIGQGLAADLPSFDFVHACNQLRTTCTTLSQTPSLSPLLRGKRAQFIPVRWRTDLNYEEDPEGMDKDKAEEELGNKFSLADIEVQDAIPLLRQVVSGLVLDVPFYLSNRKEMMIRAVVRESNRIYRLFASRNPSFAKNGHVSIIAHSLGSALTADILSKQPTRVKDIDFVGMSWEEKMRREREEFVFDTRVVFLVGSPLPFFLHLHRAQLIARKGRERTSAPDIGPDIALDRARYGCLSADSIYNIYHVTDPVAFSMNAAVDAAYSKLIKPIAIPSSNQTLLQNLSETYNRVSKLFDVSSLWSSSTSSATKEAESEEQKKELEKTREKVLEEKKEENAKKLPPKVIPKRPGGIKRMPSERPNMKKEEFDKVNRAEQRFKALNPQGCIDFYLPAEGVNQYLEAISSHGAYWYDQRFAEFILTQLFAPTEDLVKTGREEIATESQD